MHGLERVEEVTQASFHKSRVDLSKTGEVVYRDEDYFGVEWKGYDATMKRSVRGHPLCLSVRLLKNADWL